MRNTTVDRLRTRALKLLQETIAHAWIISPPDLDEIARVNKYRRNIAIAPRKQLYGIIEGLEKRIVQLRAEYSITASPDHLLGILDVMLNAPPGRFTLVPLYYWRKLFKGGRYPWSGLEVWPPHARIGLDGSGLAYSGTRDPEVFLLEAILFEDMAALFNAAKRERAGPESTHNKSKTKLSNALCRASVSSAVHFVEAYVNGLAVDYFIEHQDTLDNSVKSTLLDWDFSRKRPRYLTLKEKLLQYQRILLGVVHAPVQESNCPSMKIMLGYARMVRDAIAHPSPAFDLSTLETEKERAILGLSFEQTQEVVDAAITLVKRIESEINTGVRRLFWLQERGTDGFFPEDAFA